MATDITIPALGESITEGVIATWLKGDGDYVDRDETLLELETDKITLELPSPAAGVLKRTAAEGDTVEVGAVVGSVDESAKKPAGEGEKKSGGDDAKASAAKQEPAAKEAPKKQQPAASPEPKPSAPQKQERQPEPVGGGSASVGGGAVAATPLARKIAEEKNVDLSSISGTGPAGRVREQDVLAWIQTHQDNGQAAGAPAQGAPASGAGPSRATRRERMSPLRQRIATRLVEAQQTAAMLTTFNECDMTAVMELRKRYKEGFAEKHEVSLGFMSFFVKACVSALETYPAVNASIVQGGNGPEVEYRDYCDIAVAVGTPRGLVVPVVRNCESLSFAGVESTIKDLATRAQSGKLDLSEMQGGTFTISNGGVYGSMMSTPILNPPQSGILGMHNIVRRPIENPDKPGSGEIVVRPMMYLALSYDHRIIDGSEAVSFLVHVRKAIEDPTRLLLEL